MATSRVQQRVKPEGQEALPCWGRCARRPPGSSLSPHPLYSGGQITGEGCVPCTWEHGFLEDCRTARLASVSWVLKCIGEQLGGLWNSGGRGTKENSAAGSLASALLLGGGPA